MLSKILETAKGVLFNPVETFQQLSSEELSESVKFYAALLIFNVLITGVLLFAGLASIGSMFPGYDVIVLVPLLFILGLVSFAIGSVILHIFVYIAGGRRGIEQTVKAVAYSSAPSMLIGWIPVIGLLGTLWSLVLGVLAIREMHEISTGRAVLAIILPVILLFLVVLLLGAYLMVGSVSTASVTAI